MRTLSIVCVTMALAGCQANASVDTGDGETDGVAEVAQPSMFTDDVVFNVVDFANNPTLSMTASDDPLQVNVFYLGSKTTDNGNTSIAPVLAASHTLAANETRLHGVNLAQTAFVGGYGAVVVQAVAPPTQTPFASTLFTTEGVAYDVGGSVFAGTFFVIPYLGSSSKVVLAITNADNFDFDVEIRKQGTGLVKTIHLPIFSTYKFDSSALGWALGGPANSLTVFGMNSGVVTVSGYSQKSSSKYRIAAVKSAPYF